MRKFDLKYYRKNKYQPSNIKIKLHEDVNYFIDKVRQESYMRQIIIVDNKIVVFGVEGSIILPNGKFWYISAEVQNGKWGKHHIITSPGIEKLILKRESFLRLDSGCLSGMIFGDVTCDCLNQLRRAQNIILKRGGIIIHIPGHDGRGLQEYKMANQRIMYETKLDTITVAKKFYEDHRLIDIRTYDESILILKALGFKKGYRFNLGTKNPNKINTLIKEGFKVDNREIDVKKKNGMVAKNLKAKHLFWEGENYERNQERQMV